MSALVGRRNAPEETASPGSRPPAAAALRRVDVPPAFALARRRVGQVAVLSAVGEVDLATAPILEREALRVLPDAHGRLILDLSAITFMDLSGVRVIERLGRAASARGGQLALVAVTSGVRLMLERVPPQGALVTDCMTTAVQALSDLHR
jgi:anti-anti-sigma factor